MLMRDDSSPGHHERELTPALLAVVGETPDAQEATCMRKRARDISDIAVFRRDAVFNKATGQVEVQPGVREDRKGRDIVAAWIWDKSEELIGKYVPSQRTTTGGGSHCT